MKTTIGNKTPLRQLCPAKCFANCMGQRYGKLPIAAYRMGDGRSEFQIRYPTSPRVIWSVSRGVFGQGAGDGASGAFPVNVIAPPKSLRSSPSNFRRPGAPPHYAANTSGSPLEPCIYMAPPSGVGGIRSALASGRASWQLGAPEFATLPNRRAVLPALNAMRSVGTDPNSRQAIAGAPVLREDLGGGGGGAVGSPSRGNGDRRILAKVPSK